MKTRRTALTRYSHRFLWKLYRGAVALILVTTASIGILMSSHLERESLSETTTSLKAKAVLVGEWVVPAFQSLPDGDLEARLRKLGEEVATRFTVLTAAGRVLADSHESPDRMDDHAHRPEIIQARDSGFGASTRYSSTLRSRLMYVALPVHLKGKLVGFIRASLPLAELDDHLVHLRRMAMAVGLAALVIALGLGWIFARQITGPLRSMTDAAQALAAGHYDQRVRVASTDELGALGLAFNTMASELANRMDTILRDRNEVRAILGSMVEGVVAVDGSERIIHMNRVAQDLLSAGPEDSIGRAHRDVIHLSEVNDLLAEVAQSGQEVSRDVTLTNRMRRVALDLHAAPLRGGDGHPVGAVVVMHDVSELRRLEQVRRDFVGNVSHELKTPLTAITGLVDTLIEDETMDPSTHASFLKRVRHQVFRLSTLVADLLTLARIEAQESSFRVSPVDLREPVEDLGRTLMSVAQDKQLRLEISVPPAPLIVSGDEEALRQIINNLLDNAIKYTPAGGKVELLVRAADAHAVIEVSDTGIGIESFHQGRIFERFYRVDTARSRELGGTGLGLAIVKHLVLALKGQITVSSAPGQGSLFRVILPLDRGI